MQTTGVFHQNKAGWSYILFLNLIVSFITTQRRIGDIHILPSPKECSQKVAQFRWSDELGDFFAHLANVIIEAGSVALSYSRIQRHPNQGLLHRHRQRPFYHSHADQLINWWYCVADPSLVRRYQPSRVVCCYSLTILAKQEAQKSGFRIY